MPRYFFDVFDGDDVLADSFGDDFISDREAAKQARGLLPEFLLDKLSSKEDIDTAVSVRTQDGDVLYRTVAITRSQWADRAGGTFGTMVNSSIFQMSHSMVLRTEAADLAERIRVDAFDLFSNIQKVVATMEVSKKIIKGGGK